MQRRVCTGALTTKRPVCLATGLLAELVATDPPDTVCLQEAYRNGADGAQTCDLIWVLPKEPVGNAPAHCSDLPFLTPTSGDTVSDWLPPANLCLVDKIEPPSQATSGEEGWYYDESDTGTCDAGALRFTERAIIPEGVRALFRCPTALGLSATGDLEPVDVNECTIADDSARHANTVGDPCHPPVPEGGFLESNVYVETGTTECGTGVCLVFHLRGDPSASCETDDAGATVCAPPDDDAHRISCSCRCDAAPGEPDACDCPDHFVCERVFDNLSPGLDGSYCVDLRAGRAQ